MATAKLTTPPHPVEHTPHGAARDPGEVPSFVYLDMQDELRMWRMIALLAVSVACHVILITLILTVPRFMPHRPAEVVIEPGQENQNLTFLTLPPDIQRNLVPPKTNIISDKDRVAMSKHPTLTAPKIISAERPGPPGAPNMTGQRPVTPGSPVTPGAPQTPANQSGNQTQNTNTNQQIAALQPPQVNGGGQPAPKINFGVPLSPGTQIANAARSTVNHVGGGGVGGEYGLDPSGRSKARGDFEILSDTMGVDFAPYLTRVRLDILNNWYRLMPDAVRPPLMESGKVYIQFAITKDGHVAGLQVVGPSGRIELDRAAYAGISASNPFPPLPPQFKGQYLALRARFYYNPSKEDLE